MRVGSRVNIPDDYFTDNLTRVAKRKEGQLDGLLSFCHFLKPIVKERIANSKGLKGEIANYA